MKLQPVIGLEIHVQLKTKSKMFCGCSTHTNEHTPPNKHICPVCLGHPGTLPVPNEQAIRFAVLFGLAVDADIADRTKFDRKNYFYPDLPKGYQISQFDLPVVSGGHIDIHVPGGPRDDIRIHLTRAHLEEDAAKNIHKDGKSYVDFNRGGTPLLEIVTEPDFVTPQEAKVFLQELRLLVRTLGISDGDMEKGQLRCDANISLRELDADGSAINSILNPKTEIKNLNSFRNVERAIQFEIQRQTKLWKTNSPPAVTTTRGWDDTQQRTVAQRTKEDAADYRYFPEPDIPPLDLSDIAKNLEAHVPELPQAKRRRFMDEYGFTRDTALQLTDNPHTAEFTERVMSELGGWIEAQPDMDPASVPAAQKKLSKLVSSWIISKLGGLMNDKKIDIQTAKVTPENFAELVTLIFLGRATQRSALTILEHMLESGADPTHVMEDQGLGKMDDEAALAEIVSSVLESHPDEVARYKAGETKLLKFFLGMIMKETEGSADPGTTSNLLKVKLEEA